VVVEPVVGHGAQFSCVVLDTPRGPVALPPTEVAAYDLEHDVLEAHLDMERRQARFEVRPARNGSSMRDRPLLIFNARCWGACRALKSEGLEDVGLPHPSWPCLTKHGWRALNWDVTASGRTNLRAVCVAGCSGSGPEPTETAMAMQSRHPRAMRHPRAGTMLDARLCTGSTRSPAWRCAAQGWDEELIQDALAAGRDAAREELDWEEAALADPTRRSLPGDSLRRYTPPRFASEVIQGIRQGAAKLFKACRCLPSAPP